MFNLGDKVVYPGHGVAKINRIITKKINTQDAAFYELTFIHKDMTILVPVQSNAHNGMRPLSSQDKINAVLQLLAEPAAHFMPAEVYTNWKQRNKDYQSRLRSGNLEEVSRIYKELKHLEQQKGLSFCEKSLLQHTETLLVQEIALVKKLGEEKAIEYVRSVFHTIKHHVRKQF